MAAEGLAGLTVRDLSSGSLGKGGYPCDFHVHFTSCLSPLGGGVLDRKKVPPREWVKIACVVALYCFFMVVASCVYSMLSSGSGSHFVFDTLSSLCPCNIGERQGHP